MNSRKWAVTLAALGMICMIPTVGMADNLFELPGIGSMKLPAGVTVAEGAQATLNAVNEGRSTSDYWNHKGLRNGNFYSLTYEAPPDYSYGWALSGEVGYPFMLEAGIFTDSDLSQVEQMDSIASWMNTYFKNQKAVFSGSTPLKQEIQESVSDCTDRLTRGTRRISFGCLRLEIIPCSAFPSSGRLPSEQTMPSQIFALLI